MNLFKNNKPPKEQPAFSRLEDEIPKTLSKPELTMPTNYTVIPSQITIPEHYTGSGDTVVKPLRYRT